MAKNRTEEDWFLRGGERPSTEIPDSEPQVPEDDLEDYETGDDPEDDGNGDDGDGRGTRKFRVRIVASRTVETFVIVTATDEEDACDKVADILDNDGEFNPEAQDWDPVGSVDDPEIDDTDVTEVE